MKEIAIFLFVLSSFTGTAAAQSSVQKFKSLSSSEKCWVLRHPFRAKKAMRISNRALVLADSMRKSSTLDGDWNGGQVDAFRHSLWMAMLTDDIGWRNARGLGRAHEKGNITDFNKGRLEDGEIQDKAASEMDTWNNAQGIRLAKEMRHASEKSYVKAVIEAILIGEMKKVKKDSEGVSLDINGHFIPEHLWRGKWENKRRLVPSN